jgi:hypothetical protein
MVIHDDQLVLMAPRSRHYQTRFKIPLCNKIIQVLVLSVLKPCIFVCSHPHLLEVSSSTHFHNISVNLQNFTAPKSSSLISPLLNYKMYLKNCSLIVISHAIVIFVTVKEMEVIEWLRTPMRFFISRSDYFTVFVLYIT